MHTKAALSESADELENACRRLREAAAGSESDGEVRSRASAAHDAAKELVDETRAAFEDAIDRNGCEDVFAGIPDDERYEWVEEYADDLPEDVVSLGQAVDSAIGARNEFFYVREDVPQADADDFYVASENVEIYLDSFTDRVAA